MIHSHEEYTNRDLRDAVWPDTELSGAAFTGCSFQGADLEGLSTKGCLFTDCDFSFARLQGSLHLRSSFVNCRFSGASLFGAVFRDCKGSGKQLRRRCAYGFRDLRRQFLLFHLGRVLPEKNGLPGL